MIAYEGCGRRLRPPAIPDHVLALLQLGGRSFENDAAVAHHADAGGDLQRDGQLLLDQHHRHAALVDVADHVGDHFHDLGRQALGRLVDQHDLGLPSSERHMVSICCSPPDRLPARVPRRSFRRAEVVEHLLDGPERRVGAARLLAHAQVLVHRQVGEDLAFLGHETQTGAGDLEGALVGDVAPFDVDLPAGHVHQAHDALHGGGAAGAVAAQQVDDFAPAYGQVDAMQDVALAIVGVHAPKAEQFPVCVLIASFALRALLFPGGGGMGGVLAHTVSPRDRPRARGRRHGSRRACRWPGSRRTPAR